MVEQLRAVQSKKNGRGVAFEGARSRRKEEREDHHEQLSAAKKSWQKLSTRCVETTTEQLSHTIPE